MKKEKCGLKKLHKGFWLCLCAVALVVTCCVVVLHNVQAAGTDGWTFTLDSDKGGCVLEKVPTTISGDVEIPAEYEENGVKHSVVEIGREAFLGCKNITGISIPDSVKTIGWYAFSGCTGLTEITIPDSVTEMDWFAFSGCTGLETVTIGSGVTDISAGAFSGCTNLTDVTISGSTTIGWSAFKDCTSLKNIVLPSSVTSIDRYAFYNCGTVNAYYIGTSDGLAALETAISADGNDALVWNYVDFGGDAKHNLRLREKVYMGYAYQIDTNAENAKYGLLIWKGNADADVTVGTKDTQDKEFDFDGTYYIAESDGLLPQYLNEKLYAKPYVKIGNYYIYGTVDKFAPVDCAEKLLAGDDEALKKLMIDLLNYATCAQYYFAETKRLDEPSGEQLINHVLTAEQKESKWDASMEVETPTASKGGTLSVGWYGTNLSLLDAFQMNMAATKAGVEGLCCWTEDKYNATDSLTKDSADKMVTVRDSKEFKIGEIAGIYAKDLNSVYYMCAYDVNGELSTARADSVAAYATRIIRNQAAKGYTEKTVALAKALIVYGNSAAEYLNSQNG